jgi:hypothetical protein
MRRSHMPHPRVFPIFIPHADGPLPEGAYVFGYNDPCTTRRHTLEEFTLMGQVVSLAQHQATKQMQIREAERKAQAALLQASAAFKELHRLKGD